MSAWQIPLGVTSDPRDDASTRFQEGQFNATRNKLGQQQILNEQERIRASQNEDRRLREEQIREAKAKNDLTEAMPDLMHGYYARSQGWAADADGTPIAHAPSESPAPAPVPGSLSWNLRREQTGGEATPAPVPPPVAEPTFEERAASAGRVDDLGRPVAVSSDQRLRTVMAAPGTNDTNRYDQYGGRVIAAPEPIPTTQPQTAPAESPSASPDVRNLPQTRTTLVSSFAPDTPQKQPAPADPPAFQWAPSVRRHQDAIKWLMSQKGGYALVAGLDKEFNDGMAKDFTRHKEELELNSKRLAGLSGILTTVETAPPQDRPAIYAANLQTLRAMVKSFGYDPAILPDQYDPKVMQVIAHAGIEAGHQITEANASARAGESLVSGRIKSGADFRKDYLNAARDTKSQDELNAVNRAYEGLAKGMDEKGVMQLPQAFAMAKKETWSPDLAKRIDDSQITAEQRVTNQRAADSAAQTKAHQDELERQGNERINIQRNREVRESAAQHKEKVLALAYKAIEDGKGIDYAIRNVSNLDWYQDSETGANRGAVLDALHRIKTGDLHNEQQQGAIDENERKDQMLRDAGFLPPKPKPAAPPTNRPPAPSPSTAGRGNTLAPQTPAPTPTAGQHTEAQIRQGAANRGFDANGPEANAAVEKARAAGTLQ